MSGPISLWLHSSAFITRHSLTRPSSSRHGISYSSSGLSSTPAAEGSSSVCGPVRGVGTPRQQAGPWKAIIRSAQAMWGEGDDVMLRWHSAAVYLSTERRQREPLLSNPHSAAGAHSLTHGQTQSYLLSSLSVCLPLLNILHYITFYNQYFAPIHIYMYTCM